MRTKHLIFYAVILFFLILPIGIRGQGMTTEKQGENNTGWARHPWFGKRVGYIGDSITDPNNPAIKQYWSFLQEWLGITPFNYAVSGRQWNDVPRQAEQIKNDHWNEVDAILVFMGTNDFNMSVPIGDWFIEKEEQVMAAHGEIKQPVTRRHRTPVMSDKTFKGRINIGITKMKELFPDKQIVILTPLHRALADFGERNLQPDENYQNGCSEYIDAYIQTIKEASNIWGVTVIDLNALSGLNPMVESQLQYFANVEFDRLHPNTAGHERIARVLLYQLMALPVF